MKLVTYLAAGEARGWASWLARWYMTWPGLPRDSDCACRRACWNCCAWARMAWTLAREVLARTAASGRWPGTPLSDVRLLAPVPRPPKLLALAGNYQEHIKESGHAAVTKAKVTPRLFMKPATSVAGPGQPILLPKVSSTIDWELELLVVIGTGGKDIAAEDALAHVAGYSIFNDISSRTLHIAEGRDVRDGDWWFDWLLGKWQDSSGPMGPYLVTRDEVPQPNNLRLQLWVNDQLKQNANTGQMIFDVAETVAFASQFMTLEAGDVIATGTPSGVGATTGTYLKSGDVVRGEIEGLGVLVNPVQ